MDGIVRVYSLEGLVSHMKQITDSQRREDRAEEGGLPIKRARFASDPAAHDPTSTPAAANGTGNGTAANGTGNGAGISPAGAELADAAAVVRLTLERKLLRSLRDLVRIRSVSCDPTHTEECFKGAKYIARVSEVSLGGSEV